MKVFREMAEGFRDSVANQPLALILIVLGLGALVLGWMAVNSMLQERRLGLPMVRGLFRDLCRAHGLSRRERRALGKMVRNYQLTDPAMLFVRRSLLDSFHGLEPADAESLRGKLFGG